MWFDNNNIKPQSHWSIYQNTFTNIGPCILYRSVSIENRFFVPPFALHNNNINILLYYFNNNLHFSIAITRRYYNL